MIFHKKANMTMPDEKLIDTIEYYLNALYRNGQIVSDYDFIRNEKNYIACIALPKDDSLSKKNNNIYVNQFIEEIETAFDLDIELIGESMDQGDSCECQKSSWYFLCAEGSFESPIYCGDCGLSIPLYKIPLMDDEKEHGTILGWQSANQAMNELWIAGLHDRFTYRQISSPDSQLAKEGRKICNEIERKTGVPTYYFLHYDSWLKKPAPEACPECGGDWRIEDDEEMGFKCDDCRLVALKNDR
jgi:predicted  nucleic acid-binding Zn ribbon protein